MSNILSLAVQLRCQSVGPLFPPRAAEIIRIVEFPDLHGRLPSIVRCSEPINAWQKSTKDKEIDCELSYSHMQRSRVEPR